MPNGGHTETAFEKAITSYLVTKGGYWRAPDQKGEYHPDEALAVHFDYDRGRALFPGHVIDFARPPSRRHGRNSRPS